MNEKTVELCKYFGFTEREWKDAEELCDLMCPEPEEEEDDDRAE